VKVERDYDTSLPDLTADREQLIQVVLNVARNAAQAMHGEGRIKLRTRAHRQATLVKRRYKLALELQVIDNGPGIPEDLKRPHLLSACFRPRRRHRSRAHAGAELRASAPWHHRGA
jgi:nitrogen-specific signal transduction histidine kinase